MISFEPTEDEQAFTDMALSFAKDVIRPEARTCEETRTVSPIIIKKVEELGFNTLEIPERWGGLELPLISQVQILQALAFGDLGVVQGLPGTDDAASLIRLIPESPALRAYKEAVLSGEGGWPTAAFIDAAEGDPWGSALQITKSENGYVLNGTSRPVRLAATAEYVVVAGLDTLGDAVILWLDRPEWELVEGDYRLGLLASGLRRLHFNDYHVDPDQVVAVKGEAEHLISKIQERVYVLQAAKEVGLMDAALAYATEYTAGRKAFGQEIAKFQGVSFTVADMAFERQASHHLVWQAAVNVDEQTENALGYALRVLYRAHRSLRFITDSAVQLLGGHGFVQEFPVEKWMRDAQAQVVLYGREKALLLRRGKEILNGSRKEVAK